jgi:hypothetical protein
MLRARVDRSARGQWKPDPEFARYRRLRSQAGALVFFSIFALFCLGALVNGVVSGTSTTSTWVLGWSAAGLCVASWMSWRCFRSGTVIATQNGVQVRSFLRNNKYRWEDIASISIGRGPINANIFSVRSFPLLELKDGRRKSITGFNGPRPEYGETGRIEQAVAELETMRKQAARQTSIPNS